MNKGTTMLLDELIKEIEDSLLTEFYCWGWGIGDEETIVLAQALKKNDSITVVGLEGNKIGDDGAQALAEMLKVNTTITHLNLADNKIGDEGKSALEKAKRDNLKIAY